MKGVEYSRELTGFYASLPSDKWIEEIIDEGRNHETN